MKLLIIRSGGEIEAVINGAGLSDAEAHVINGYPHLSGHQLDFEEVEGILEDYPVVGAIRIAHETAVRIEALHVELDHLELATAKGFLWLVKALISNGTIQLADIPDKLIAYKNRIEEIEAELNI